MAAEIRPRELADLVDLSERPRVDDWSLRAALVRYAQREPERVSAVLEVVRRIEAVLHPQAKVLAKEGPQTWDAVTAGTPGPMPDLLRAMQPLDALGDRLAAWAVDRAGDPPDAEVDRVVASVTARLDELGVPREQRERPPPGARRRG